MAEETREYTTRAERKSLVTEQKARGFRVVNDDLTTVGLQDDQGRVVRQPRYTLRFTDEPEASTSYPSRHEAAVTAYQVATTDAERLAVIADFLQLTGARG